MTEPILPTRIIPAGAPLPARSPEPGEAPPWRTPPPPPPPPPPVVPPPPPPQPVEIRHVHEVRVTLADPDPEPEPSHWERITGWLGRYVRPWHALAGLAAAVLPIPTTGYSAATTWHYTVGVGRDEWGIGWGYALGLVPLAVTVSVIVRNGGSPLRLFVLAVTSIGAFGAISWWDPFQFLTGVSR